MIDFPHLGHGVGLRAEHFPRVLDGTARADWFEVISENYMIRGGRPLKILERARELAPIVMHGVSMNLGGVDPLRADYLRDLDALVRRFEPAWVSDHLCWGAIDGHYAHDLLPLPFTEDAIVHVAARIREVQDRLGRRILIENVSSYLTYEHSTLPEWVFLTAVAAEADCGILLDINNIYVNSVNQVFDPMTYLRGVPIERVGQFHLAGHSDAGTYLIDTHDHPVALPVWNLYREAVRRFGRVSSLIERDDNIPAFEEVIAEADHARAIEAEVLNVHADAA
ncbi:MAG: DUF692 domain-containing protein [Candidatus Binataceae bacterium]